MRAFTLIELLLVMIVLGFVLGLSLAGVDKLDPGAEGLVSASRSFVASSRDVARASGREVVVSLDAGTADRPPRLQRALFRPLLEASFEAAARGREHLEPTGGVELGSRPGRVGAGLHLEGGTLTVAGRGGRFPVGQGFGLEFDLRPAELEAATLLSWPELLKLRMRVDGGVDGTFGYAQEDARGSTVLHTPGGILAPGRWAHVRLTMSEGALRLRIDGRLLAEGRYDGQPLAPGAPPELGSSDGAYFGDFDEFSVWTRILEAGPDTREDVLVSLRPARLVFDRDGLLTTDLDGAPARLEVVEHGTVVATLLVGRFGEEAELP